MKIHSINSIISYKGVTSFEKEKSEIVTEQNNKKHTQQYATVGAGVAAVIGGLIIHKNIKIHKVEKAAMDALAAKFPKDVEYRKELLRAIGFPENEWFSIRSIIGGQEYKAIATKFSDSAESYTPGVNLFTKSQDDYNLIGVANRTFRISLHNHTTASDGKMSVKELLDQAAKYADEVADFNNAKQHIVAKDAPFTIAITDHDTLDGCKEAVKIISQNPDKFKNLRVVFGTELSVENKMLGEALVKPVPIHMVVNCINPFDRSLNEFLDLTKLARKNVAEEFLNEFKAAISPAISARLNLDEARNYSTVLKDGLNYPWYYMKEYVKTKLNPTEEKNVLDVYYRIQEKFAPKLDLPDYCMDMVDAMNVFKQQKYGYMTIAHPALTPVGNCVKNPVDSHSYLSKLISLFKVHGEDKSFGVEVHYPYFGDVANSLDWLNTISKAVSDNGLIATGGLDSHGKSIFYSAI